MSGLLLPYKGVMPRIASDAFIADGSKIIGDVSIESRANVWFNCVVRGDEHAVTIGANTNIQDGTVIHVHSLKQGTFIGADVTVGHMCLLHACTLEDGAFCGMGAIVLDGAVIESGAMLAAGAMLTPGKRIPSGELWAGRPARFSRALSPEELDGMPRTIENYVGRAEEYLKVGIGKPAD
jgi:carbonic anhydrase/acetyltransferase-like protein (isoleucine patch superfamily)